MLKSYEYFVFALAVIAIALTIGLLAKLASSDGRVDYCYVVTTPFPGASYRIVGHRPWRFDLDVAYAGDFTKADELMRQSAVCSGK